MDEHTARAAKEELNEPEDAAAALAAFTASVTEAYAALRNSAQFSIRAQFC